MTIWKKTCGYSERLDVLANAVLRYGVRIPGRIMLGFRFTKEEDVKKE